MMAGGGADPGDSPNVVLNIERQVGLDVHFPIRLTSDESISFHYESKIAGVGDTGSRRKWTNSRTSGSIDHMSWISTEATNSCK